MENEKVVAILGVGPGLGGSIARRFAREGYTVALLARRIESLRGVHKQITGDGGRALSVPADATDPESIAAAFAEVRTAVGDPEILVYNAGAFQRGGALEITPGKQGGSAPLRRVKAKWVTDLMPRGLFSQSGTSVG